MKIPMWYWCWVLVAGMAIGSYATQQFIEKSEKPCTALERKQ